MKVRSVKRYTYESRKTIPKHTHIDDVSTQLGSTEIAEWKMTETNIYEQTLHGSCL